MIVEGVSFNPAVVSKYKTAEEFAGHKSVQHLWPGKTPEIRKQLFQLVFDLIKLQRESNT